MLRSGCDLLRHCHWASFALRPLASSRYQLLIPFHSKHLATRWTTSVACKTHSNNSSVQPSPSSESATQPPHCVARRPHLTTKPKYRFVRSRHLRSLLTEIEELRALRRSGKLLEGDERISSLQVLPLLKDGTQLRTLTERLVDAHEPFSACHALRLAHHLGYKFKVNVYEAVAYRLAETEQWNAVPLLVRIRKDQTGSLTIRLLNWLARAYIETNQFVKLDTILQAFERAGVQPTRRTYHLLVSGHIRNRNLPKAKEYLSAMEQAGFPIDPSTHALIVSVHRSLGLDQSMRNHALASVPQLESRTGTIVLNSLIQMCLDVHDINSAWVYLTMFGRPVKEFPHLSESGESFTVAGGDHGRVNTLQDKLLEDDTVLSPDIATFTMLLNYTAKQGDVARAQVLLERVRELDLKPDGQFVAALIRVHLSSGDLVTALSLTAHTCRDIPGARPRLHDLGLPITDEGRPEMLSQPVPPSIHVLNSLLPGALEKFGLKGASLVYRIMRVTGIPPDAYTIEHIITYLSNTEHVRPRELIRLLRFISGTFIPTQRHVHVILGSVIRSETQLVKSRGWKHKRDVVQAPDDRLSTVSETFDPLAGIQLPRKLSYRSLIRPVLKILSKRRIRSDKATVALRIRHDGVVKRDINVAKESFQTLLDRGMHPNQYHYAAIMESFVKADEIESAEQVLKKAIADGLTPNPVLYTIIISGYATHGNPKEASRWFYDMIERGVRPDIAAIDAMASAYFVVGAHATARKFLLDCWKHIGPVPESMQEASLREIAHGFRAMATRKGKGNRQPTSKIRLRVKLKQLLQKLNYRRRPNTTKQRNSHSDPSLGTSQ